MNTSKDFIKFRQYIRTLYLKVNEQYLLEYFFEYTNTDYGYAFPKFSDIMSAFNTTSKNRISGTIKKLESKGLIRVCREFSNNRYYIIRIENLINTSSKHNDKNGNKTPIEGQVTIEDLTEEESKVIELTGITQNQARRLLELSKNKVDKVVEYAKYTLNRGVKNAYGYIKKLIMVNADVITKEKYKQNHSKKSIPFIENCSSRNYDEAFYENLEERLLGWT
jgi:SOS-response transcriptional repressor LexA